MLVKINSGSFGKVYKITDKEKVYALKHIEHKSYDLDCFLEILIMYCLKYKFLMSCFDFFVDSSKHISKILMPFAESDLYKYVNKIKEKDKLQLRLRTIFWQLSCALGFLHSNNIIHGDIKPSNILVKSSQVLLSDFSLSNICFNEDHRIYNKQAYTNFYRAPEVSSDSGYTFKADIYALGCSFYEIFYKEPFSPGIKSYTNLLSEPNKEFRKLLFNMLHPCDFKRFSIWQILECDYFKDFKSKDSIESKDLNFPLCYKTLDCSNIFDFSVKLKNSMDLAIESIEPLKSIDSIESKSCIPVYIFEILSMKLFNRVIEKKYAIFLNSSFFEKEKSIIESIKNFNIKII
jgi:serine/threonine protein kinase